MTYSTTVPTVDLHSKYQHGIGFLKWLDECHSPAFLGPAMMFGYVSSDKFKEVPCFDS